MNVCRIHSGNQLGEFKYCLEWKDNDGIGREHYFRTRSAAEKYATRAEIALLEEAIDRFTEEAPSHPPKLNGRTGARFTM